MQKLIIYLPIVICLCALAGCNTGYKKIDGQWYFVTWDEGHGTRRTLLDVDDTFRVLANPMFAKDGSSVYYDGQKVETADAGTFQTLDDFCYAKDKNSVYVCQYRILNANPDAFEILGYPYSRDHTHVFCGTIPIDVKNVDEFKVVKPDSMIHETSIDRLKQKIPGLSLSEDTTIVIGEGEGRTRSQRFLGPYEVN